MEKSASDRTDRESAMPQRVQFPDAIEPLVLFIEETPPGEILDRTLDKLRAGVPTQLLASNPNSASSVAGIGRCKIYIGSAGSCATAVATPNSASAAKPSWRTDIVSCRWLRRDNGGQAGQPAVAQNRS